jgi:hypothetical protein
MNLINETKIKLPENPCIKEPTKSGPSIPAIADKKEFTSPILNPK